MHTRSPAGRAGRPPAAAAPARSCPIFEGLDHEWARLSGPAGGVGRLARWAAAEPALAGCPSLGQLPGLVAWDGYRPSGPGGQVLSALLRLATDPVAARALLQALLPRLRAERVATARFGHGVGEYAQAPADTMADLVGEAFAAICRHAGEDRPDVARLVVQEAARRLRTARQAQRRYQQRALPLRERDLERWAAGPGQGPTAAERVARAVCQAVASGHLSRADGRLVYAARVKGLSALEVGRAEGLPGKTVYYALAKAERALLATAA